MSLSRNPAIRCLASRQRRGLPRGTSPARAGADSPASVTPISIAKAVTAQRLIVDRIHRSLQRQPAEFPNTSKALCATQTPCLHKCPCCWRQSKTHPTTLLSNLPCRTTSILCKNFQHMCNRQWQPLARFISFSLSPSEETGGGSLGFPPKARQKPVSSKKVSRG